MHCVRTWVLVAQRIIIPSYVTMTYVILCTAYSALCISVCTLWPLPCHTVIHGAGGQEQLIYLSPRSEPLKRAAKFMASLKSSGHCTSHLAILSPPPQSSICAIPCLSLSLATGCAVWTQHLQKNILAAFTHSSHFSLHLLSPLHPVLPAWRGTQCECCTVICTHFLSLPLFSLIFSRKILCKAFGLGPVSHVVYSDQRVDELSALPLLTQ